MTTLATPRVNAILALTLLLVATVLTQTPRRAQALTNCTVSATDLVFDQEERNFLELVNGLNDYRKANGAGALTVSVNLNRSAAWMAHDLVTRADSPSHTDTLGRNPLLRMQDCDAVAPGADIAENIAGGPASTGLEILEQWKLSPTHDYTMKNPSYVQIGIARAYNPANQYPWQWATNFSTVDDGTRVGTNPITVLSSPVAGPVGSSFEIVGYAIDAGAALGNGTGIDSFQAAVYPSDASGNATGGAVFLSTAYGAARNDVAQAYGTQFTNSGFASQTPTLSPGIYVVVIYAHSSVSSAWNFLTRVVAVSGPVANPIMVVDSPSYGIVPASFLIQGWSIDNGSPTGTGVDMVQIHVYPSNAQGAATGNPVFSSTSYGIPRGEVGQTYGARFTNSGFRATTSQLQAGYYLAVVYSHSTVDQHWTYVTRLVQVLGQVGAISWPPASSNQPSSFLIQGWAIDQGASSGTGIDQLHIAVYPSDANGNATGGSVIYNTTSYGTVRGDVAQTYGAQFTNSGYSATATMTTGLYVIVIYSHSSVSNKWSIFTRVIGVGVQPLNAALQEAPSRGEVPAPSLGPQAGPPHKD